MTNQEPLVLTEGPGGRLVQITANMLVMVWVTVAGLIALTLILWAAWWIAGPYGTLVMAFVLPFLAAGGWAIVPIAIHLVRRLRR